MSCLVMTVVSLLAISGWAPQTAKQSLEQQLAASVVRITAYDAAGGLMQRGLGLIVSKDGHVLVSFRLLDGASKVEITTVDGATRPITRIVAKDAYSGMALILAEVAKSARPVPVSGEHLRAGDKVFVAEPDDQSIFSLSEVAVTSSQSSLVSENLAVTAKLSSGPVGSPIFSLAGELIGMVTLQPSYEASFTAFGGPRLPIIVEQMIKGKPIDQGLAGRPDESVPRVGVIHGEAIKRVEPSYPFSAKQSGVGGTVMVQVTIDEKGNVADAKAVSVKITRPFNVSEKEARLLGEDLKRAAVSAVRKWKFRPTLFSGSPVRAIGTITFSFSPSSR